MQVSIEELRARLQEADAQAHEAENLLLATRLVAASAEPDPQVAAAALELRARAQRLRQALQALEGQSG